MKWKIFCASLVLIGAFAAYFSLKNSQKLNSPVPQSKVPAAEPEVKEPVAFSEKEYDHLLSRPVTGLDGTRVGPAVLKASSFWPGPQKSSLNVEVALPNLPNFDIDARFARITIDRVLSNKGDNVYDEKNDKFFKYFSMREAKTPIPHLDGERDVQLMGGVSENNITRIEGTLILELPLNIQTISFTQGDLGQEKKINGNILTLKSIQKGQLIWNYQGSGKNFIRIKVFDSAGKELKLSYGSSPSREEKYATATELNDTFEGDVV